MEFQSIEDIVANHRARLARVREPNTCDYVQSVRLNAYMDAHPKDAAQINKALIFANEAHKFQTRQSGEPYIHHPISVADILCGMNAAPKLVITALLHDTVEDTDTSIETIREEFGDEVAELVFWLTKIRSDASGWDYYKVQQRNIDRLYQSLEHNVGAMVVKLADKLHNMRTLLPCNIGKRIRIADEVLTVFAPLADRLGMRALRNELQDVAFQVINASTRSVILAYISEMRKASKAARESLLCVMESVLVGQVDGCTVYMREKSAYSIWNKTLMKLMPTSGVCDLFGFRVITRSVNDCYKVLSIIHQSFCVMEGTFVDYIANPKSNGYRSLHTSLFFSESGATLEVQIRTEEMEHMAEYGVASHWTYKASPIDRLPYAMQKSSDEQIYNYKIVRDLSLPLSNNTCQAIINGDLCAVAYGSTVQHIAAKKYAQHVAGGFSFQVNDIYVASDYAIKHGDRIVITPKKNQQTAFHHCTTHAVIS